jgi:Protein of unknown function (DUF1614)
VTPWRLHESHALPAAEPAFFAILVGLFLLLVALIGADLLNLGAIQGLGAPIASIGGAGTFDGIFLTAILAVLIAGLSPIPRGRVEGRDADLRPAAGE